MGNAVADTLAQGAKAQQKRERNAKDSKVAKSQLKVNQQAMNIQCQICKATFLSTTKGPARRLVSWNMPKTSTAKELQTASLARVSKQRSTSAQSSDEIGY
ncbi:hypothetical protein E4U54_006315 [Claviceps lovelessii]|nr:hypothetical protein E4U54_006315 [Claviceps lovelessii]